MRSEHGVLQGIYTAPVCVRATRVSARASRQGELAGVLRLVMRAATWLLRVVCEGEQRSPPAVVVVLVVMLVREFVEQVWLHISRSFSIIADVLHE